MSAENLGPQFLFHGTARDIPGKILPSAVHGQGSYWGDAGTSRGEPSKDFAWAHPDESRAWEFAQDRLNHHFASGEGHVRTRVYAVHQNEQQSPGHDPSIPGEVKSPHFDIAHQVDIQPGRQGTFPEIDWNSHTLDPVHGLPGEDDANHPDHLSEQFGHSYGARAWGDATYVAKQIHQDATEEDSQRRMAHSDDRNAKFDYKMVQRTKDDPLPIPAMRNKFGRPV